MDQRLKNLKKAMKSTVFNELPFTEKHRAEIKRQTKRHGDLQSSSVNDILTVLNSKKTGFEIAKFLIARGVKAFLKNEGLLYAQLHKLEQEGLIDSQWEFSNDQKQKYYFITDKGKKLLAKSERSSDILKTIMIDSPEGSA
ncbi:PadR family transcriptional regulator [Bacillus sp. FJAT-29790]|uniref:PadR family transcriptional regulator n=1 Tax=Bacillus sp. FJAT-29790 TaxID=1895002 RepID=UPI001C238E1C|nr:PadR family transcriptional regulator [Bacillus sp. FJAT-29790]MBU8878354.1 PadR family transcriptional regulator [Bacillus sp. FJAT-29790]